MSKNLKHIFIVEESNYSKSYLDDLNMELKKKENFDYMLYIRSFIGKETDIVKKCCMLFRKERLRFYACGNFEMVEGIIKGLDCFDDREVAFCPLGNKNGLIKNFEDNYVNFKLDALISGQVKCIDYVDAGDVCLTNLLSAGAMSYTVNELKNLKETYGTKTRRERFRIISKIIKDIVVSHNDKLKITIDDNILDDDYSLAHIANGHSYNCDMDNDYNLEDGLLEYVLVKKCSFIQRLKVIKSMLDGTLGPIDDVVYMGSCRKFSITNETGKNILMSFDGRKERRSRVDGNVKSKKLRLVIPQVH